MNQIGSGEPLFSVKHTSATLGAYFVVYLYTQRVLGQISVKSTKKKKEKIQVAMLLLLRSKRTLELSSNVRCQ